LNDNNCDLPTGFNHQHSTIKDWLTGPSTNGRSSAFGALCLGSNPSGPARNQFSVASTQLPEKPLAAGWQDKR
jgi:hypothetical protein